MTPLKTESAERKQLATEMAAAKVALEAKRLKEPELRAELVRSLQSLAYEAGRAAFKLSTREWEEGSALDTNIERMKADNEALTELIADIHFDEQAIRGMQGDLDDDAIWEGAA